MTRDKKLAELHAQVRHDRARLEEAAASWGWPLGALAAGVFLPVLTDSSSANPLKHIYLLARRTVARVVRFFFFHAVYDALERHGVLDSHPPGKTR